MISAARATPPLPAKATSNNNAANFASSTVLHLSFVHVPWWQAFTTLPVVQAREFVALESFVAIAVTNHHQRLARAFLMLLRAGRHAPLENLNHQRSFGAIAHVNLRPGRVGLRSQPAVDTLPRPLRVATGSAVRRGIELQITD